MQALGAARKIDLSDWMIGAGFVRNAVWDRLHGFTEPTPLKDIDFIYFDPDRLDADFDKAIEHQLLNIAPGLPWSVRNQARMHVRNDDRPYTSCEDAVAHWLETPTCVAVLLDKNEELSLIAPHGVEDLFNFDVRPTPSGLRKPEIYAERIQTKNWTEIWPKLTIHLA